MITLVATVVSTFLMPFLNCMSVGLTMQQPSNVSFQLEVLDKILLGPLSGLGLVVYLDPALDVGALDQVLARSALQDNPHVLVDLGSDGAQWSQEQTHAVLRAANLIHVVLFQDDPRPFFESVSLQWNPKYLLLFSLGDNSSQNILLTDTFQRIEKLALIQTLSPRSAGTFGKAACFTHFPFSNGKKLRLIKVWDNRAPVAFEKLFVDRFPSFEGYEFQLSTSTDDIPYLFQKPDVAEVVGDGVAIEMLACMARALHYTWNITVEAPDGQWGSLVNGSWTGILGLVHRQEKNFTSNSMTATDERLAAFDASVSYWMEGFGMTLMNPPPLAKWRGTYYPFTASLWVCLAPTFLLALIIMSVQDRLQPRPFLGGLGRTWTLMLRPMVSQTMPALPSAQWQRVFVATWWICCFILTTAYTANLIAFLTIPVFPERIQTVQQLAQSDYRVVMVDYGEFVPAALKSSKSEIYGAIGAKLDLAGTYDNAVRLMTSRSHAFLDLYSYNRWVVHIQYQVNNSYMLRDQLYPGHLCWYFQKNTAWKYKFDLGIQRVVEAGLIAHWLKLKMEVFLGTDYDRREAGEGVPGQGGERTALTPQHVQGIFFLLLMGWCVAALTFPLELLTFTRHKYQNPPGV